MPANHDNDGPCLEYTDGFVSKQLELLGASLDQSLIHTRQQSGRTFSYIEGHDAIRQANRIFGYGGWSYRFVSQDFVSLGDRGLYRTVVEVHVNGAVRSGVGVGIVVSNNAEGYETAIKGSETDALKRALRTFGSQFGNDLYRGDQPEPEIAPTRSPGGSSITDPQTKMILGLGTRELGLTIPQTRDQIKKLTGKDLDSLTKQEASSVIANFQQQIAARKG